MPVCGLRQGAVNAGGSQAGISGWGTLGSPILHFFVLTIFVRPFDLLRSVRASASHPCAFRIFQGQFQLTSQRIHRGPRALPDAFTLEPDVANTAAPRRDYTADRTVIGTVRMAGAFSPSKTPLIISFNGVIDIPAPSANTSATGSALPDFRAAFGSPGHV